MALRSLAAYLCQSGDCGDVAAVEMAGRRVSEFPLSRVEVLQKMLYDGPVGDVAYDNERRQVKAALLATAVMAMCNGAEVVVTPGELL